MAGVPQLPRMSDAEAGYTHLISERSTRAVLHAYFSEQFEISAGYAARPDTPADDTMAYCKQMAVWLKLMNDTKGK